MRGKRGEEVTCCHAGVREGRTPSKRWLAEKRIRRKWERERTKEDIDRQTDNFNNMHLNWYIICIYCRWSLSYKPCQHFLIKKTLQKKLWFYGKPAKHKILILVSFSDSGFTPNLQLSLVSVSGIKVNAILKATNEKPSRSQGHRKWAHEYQLCRYSQKPKLKECSVFNLRLFQVTASVA